MYHPLIPCERGDRLILIDIIFPSKRPLIRRSNAFSRKSCVNLKGLFSCGEPSFGSSREPFVLFCVALRPIASLCVHWRFLTRCFSLLFFLLEERARPGKTCFAFVACCKRLWAFMLRPSVASKRVISLKVWIWPQRTSERRFFFCGAWGFVFTRGAFSLSGP